MTSFHNSTSLSLCDVQRTKCCKKSSYLIIATVSRFSKGIDHNKATAVWRLGINRNWKNIKLVIKRVWNFRSFKNSLRNYKTSFSRNWIIWVGYFRIFSWYLISQNHEINYFNRSFSCFISLLWEDIHWRTMSSISLDAAVGVQTSYEWDSARNWVRLV